MDPGDYRDARWHALLREAEDLGVPPERAAGTVDAVLTRERRRIRRADDPDPLVREALRDAVLGRPTPTRRRWPAVVALAVALTAVGGVVALTRPDPLPTDHLRADQVPSLFGYDGPTAERLLTDRGLRVELQPFQSCEVQGRVVAVNPPPGTTYDAGDPVTVFTAIPADVTCLPNYTDRVLAWRWLDFALGHAAAPSFAGRVFVYPSDGRRLVLTGREAADRASWQETGILDALTRAATDVSLVEEHPVTYAVPAIRVVDATEGLGSCGVPEPAVAGDANAIAVLVRSADRSGCPLRVELYRDRAGRVESVALYPAS
jgi:hypothetical protein